MEETREARLERRLVRGMSQSLSPTVRQQHQGNKQLLTAKYGLWDSGRRIERSTGDLHRYILCI